MKRINQMAHQRGGFGKEEARVHLTIAGLLKPIRRTATYEVFYREPLAYVHVAPGISNNSRVFFKVHLQSLLALSSTFFRCAGFQPVRDYINIMRSMFALHLFRDAVLHKKRRRRQ